MPVVSVVIPTHNRAGLVGSAIESVLNQTFRDLEIIVVDDASEDDTEKAVRGFRDARIRYIRHSVGKGDAAARNSGIRNATGEYIAFLDDDDEWLPEKLSWQLAEFEKGGERIGLVHGGQITCFVATGRTSVPRLTGVVANQYPWGQITTSSVMVRRESIEGVGLFDEGFPSRADADLWIRVWRAGIRFGYIDRPVVRYFVHGNSLSGSPWKVIAGKEKLMQKHAEFFAQDSVSRQSEQYRRLGLLYWTVGDVRKAREALAQALRLRPRLSTWACYILSLGGSRSYRGAWMLRGLFRRQSS